MSSIELQLLNSYVELEREEIEYVYGGFAVGVALEFNDVGRAIAIFLDAHDIYPNNWWIG